MKPLGERLPNLPLAQKMRREAEGARDLPPIAAQHDDLEAIKKAIEDAASVSGPLWLSYLFALFYIALAAAGVTHVDLLLERPVELPFLQIKLPLIAFFILAPVLFIITHAYILAHFVLLADKATRFHQQLYKQIADGNENAAEIRKGLRRQLPSNIFVQFLAGPEDLREGAFGRLLMTIAWTTLAIGPVFLLLLLQLQFLPYHESGVTWVARVALALDLGLIWWLWRRILLGRAGVGSRLRMLKTWSLLTLGGCVSFIAWHFSWFVATFPGEWEELPYSYSFVSWAEPLCVAATERVFRGHNWILSDAFRGADSSWPMNRLQLKEFNIYEELKVDPTKAAWKTHLFDFQGRRLEYADFTDSNLERVNFANAFLKGALFGNAQLQGASFYYALLPGAWLNSAHLQGARFAGANLQGASLWAARLEGASFESGLVEGADLAKANLQGANFKFAALVGASLDESLLQGAQLDRAELLGASLESSELRSAGLYRAFVWRVNWNRIDLGQLTAISSGELQWGPFERFASAPIESKSGSTVVILFETKASNELLQHDSTSGGAVWKEDWRDVLNKSKPWTIDSYRRLKRSIEGVPEGKLKSDAMKRIERLDCNKEKDENEENLASCDPKAPEPPQVRAWRNILEKASAATDANPKALADVLFGLVCSGDNNAVYILRGIAANDRLADTGTEAPALIDRIISKDCPVSASLTPEDKAALLKLKQQALAAAKNPQPEPSAAAAPSPSPPSARASREKEKK